MRIVFNAIAMFDRTLPTRWVTLLLFLPTTAAYATGSVIAFEQGLFRPTIAATRGLVDAAFLCGAAALLVIVGGVIIGIGRLRPRDVGLGVGKLPLALGVTVGLWLLAQIVGLVAGLVDTGSITIHRDWSQFGIPWVVGALMGQLLGNALFEEIAYRGFLLPQVYVKLAERSTRLPPQHFIRAVVISQAAFALMHIPIRLHQGTAPAELPLNLVFTVLVGVFFCWIYLRTENLFVAVGVHALINEPTPLFESTLDSQQVLFVLAVLMLLAWPRVGRHSAHS